MQEKSTHLQVIPEHPKHRKSAITDMHKKLFLLYNKGVDFSSRNNFANFVPLQKFLFLFSL